MIDVVTDLLGEVVELYQWDFRHDRASTYALQSRGHVRAVYVANKALTILVEHDLGAQSVFPSERALDGGFEAFAFNDFRVRVVQRCRRCLDWDQKALLSRIDRDNWEHKDGEGCKKVGA